MPYALPKLSNHPAFCGFRTAFLAALLAVGSLPAYAGYEKPGDLKASSILKAELLKGQYYKVDETVKYDGMFNHYTVQSDFGTFQADSTAELKKLIIEINAIAEMKKVETDDAAIEGLKQSGANVISGVTHLVAEPKETLSGAVAGIGSLFNRTKETVGKRKSGDTEDSTLKQLVGISKAKGKIASQFGVNVYSTNEALQDELDRLGQADFWGGIGTTIATSLIPGVGGIVISASGTARLLNDAINTTPASELWLQNKNKLSAMGMDEDTSELFLNNPAFDPAKSTVFVAALEVMKGVDNRELFVKVALQASDARMASLITRITVMTAAYHKNVSALKSVTPLARVTQGIRKDGARIIVLPIDYMIWDQRVADIMERMPNGENSGEIWVLGKVSKQASDNIQKKGWKVQSDTGPRLLPEPK